MAALGTHIPAHKNCDDIVEIRATQRAIVVFCPKISPTLFFWYKLLDIAVLVSILLVREVFDTQQMFLEIVVFIAVCR